MHADAHIGHWKFTLYVQLLVSYVRVLHHPCAFRHSMLHRHIGHSKSPRACLSQWARWSAGPESATAQGRPQLHVPQQVPCVRANLSTRPPPWAGSLQGLPLRTWWVDKEERERVVCITVIIVRLVNIKMNGGRRPTRGKLQVLGFLLHSPFSY